MTTSTRGSCRRGEAPKALRRDFPEERVKVSVSGDPGQLSRDIADTTMERCAHGVRVIIKAVVVEGRSVAEVAPTSSPAAGSTSCWPATAKAARRVAKSARAGPGRRRPRCPQRSRTRSLRCASPSPRRATPEPTRSTTTGPRRRSPPAEGTPRCRHGAVGGHHLASAVPAGLRRPQPQKPPRSSRKRFYAELPNECWQAERPPRPAAGRLPSTRTSTRVPPRPNAVRRPNALSGLASTLARHAGRAPGPSSIARPRLLLRLTVRPRIGALGRRTPLRRLRCSHQGRTARRMLTGLRRGPPPGASGPHRHRGRAAFATAASWHHIGIGREAYAGVRVLLLVKDLRADRHRGRRTAPPPHATRLTRLLRYQPRGPVPRIVLDRPGCIVTRRTRNPSHAWSSLA